MTTKHDNNTIGMVNHKDIQVLMAIQTGNITLKLLGNHLKLDKGNLHRRLRRLMAFGLIHKDRIGNIVNYNITEPGNSVVVTFLRGVSQRKVGNLPIRTHALEWTSQITKIPRGLHDKLQQHNFIATPMRNWVKYRRQHGDVKVIFTSRSVQYHVGQFWAVSKEEYRRISLEKVEERPRKQQG
jgi:DNA-binding Lrp family transcriptional regulator